MIIDYSRASHLARLYDVVDRETGEPIPGLIYYFADDVAGIIRQYTPRVGTQFPTPSYLVGPDDCVLESEIRRPIRIIIRPDLSPADAELAAQVLDHYRDWVSPDWPPERIDKFVESALYAFAHSALGREALAEVTAEFHALIQRFRRLLSELHPLAKSDAKSR